MQLDHFGMYPERAFMKVAGRMTFEGGGKGSAPPAPDYTGAAQQTAAGNLATARIGQYGNMVNQVTPQGSVTYTPRTTGYINTSGQSLTPEEYSARKTAGEDVSGFNPLEQWTQQVNLSPEQQTAYNKDVAMNARLQDVGIQGVDYVQQALNRPLESPGQAVGTAGTTPFVTGVGIPDLQTDVASAGKIQRSLVNPTIDVTGQIANAGDLQRNVVNNAGQITTQSNNPELLQQQVTDALYKQQTQYLDPQFAQSQAKLETQLANQGITRGTEAWNNAIQEQARQKQQAYESARQSAIGQGVGAASTLYGNQLAGLQFGNQALGQQFGQNVTQAQLVNAAQGQLFGQNLSASQLQNQANAQQVQNALNYGQFVNQAQQQQYQQNLADLQSRNAALQATYGMGLSNAQLANQAANQQYAQQLSNAQLANQALQQNFGINQTLRQEPINILNAVRTGSQLQSATQPQVGVSQPGQLATVSGPDYLSAATATGQYNQGLYNAQQAQSSNQMSGLMGLGGTAMMAGAMAY